MPEVGLRADFCAALNGLVGNARHAACRLPEKWIAAELASSVSSRV
jgi:hypothetical protein